MGGHWTFRFGLLGRLSGRLAMAWKALLAISNGLLALYTTSNALSGIPHDQQCAARRSSRLAMGKHTLRVTGKQTFRVTGKKTLRV